MKNALPLVGGMLFILTVILTPFFMLWRSEAAEDNIAWLMIPKRLPHTDHSSLMEGPYTDGPAVTRACLECHQESAHEIMKTAHYKWEGDPVLIPGRAEAMRVGKKNLINNFCIGIQSNWEACTSCHAGYGWKDAAFDFSIEENVDCLVCHDRSGTYIKGKAGLPAEGVNLVAAAKSVGMPTRENCGSCHFRGGGGDAVKHGDLDASLTHPRERVDVHMGKHNLICADCHKTKNHTIRGRSISVSVDNANRLDCSDCHTAKPHKDARLNAHTGAVACASCHIPEVAIREATKMHWDWSTAGKDSVADPHTYMKIKGSFVYQKELIPEYYWFDGTVNRYLFGDTINPEIPTRLNPPRGSIEDPAAKIWPFKVHRGKQIYDKKYRYLLQPKTAGEGGYWNEFDWDKAVRLGSQAVGMPYSGEYDFAPTEMHWTLTHMVAPKENSLQCADCHNERGRLNWRNLGYEGDPVKWGARKIPAEIRASGEISQ